MIGYEMSVTYSEAFSCPRMATKGRATRLPTRAPASSRASRMNMSATPGTYQVNFSRNP